MSGSSLQGRWMPSSVTEEDIKKLREARCLTAEISHRLPARGQVIPTSEPNEDIVFIPHFLRGLGLTLDPFVRGLMFYYELDFHDLASDSFLHGQRVPFQRCPDYGSGSGFTSQLPEVPSGWPPLLSAWALHHN